MKIFKTLFVIGLTFTVWSCDNDFDEINQDPNNPTAVPSDLLIADAIFNVSNRLQGTFVAGDMGATWAQLWSKVQYNDEERYTPRESILQAIWDDFYEDLVSDMTSMEELAIAEGNDYSQGVALTLQAYALLSLTDMYGDVPNTEAARAAEGIFLPIYDPQEVVYDTAIARLNRAHMLLSTGSGSINTTADIVFAGDAVKWNKFANTLQFRALMRISGRRDVSAALTSLMSRPMMTSNADNASVKYLSDQPSANPLYETIVFGTRLEWKVSDVLIATLEDLGDPRLTIMASPNADGDYRGKPVGIQDVPNEEYNYDNVSGLGEFYLAPDLPGTFLSYAEFQYLLAEAAMNGLVSGDAATYYNAGITASMMESGIEDMAAIAAYLASSGVAYSASEAMEQIGTQKWLSLFTQGVEAWTEWRRTGIPSLSPAIEAAIDEIPSRYTYPTAEQTTNSINYAAAAAGLSNGDRLNSKVWWDVN